MRSARLFWILALYCRVLDGVMRSATLGTEIRRRSAVPMRSNNTVAMDSHALGTLNYIRASIEAAGAFAVPGTAGIAMGAVGLVAAAVASIPPLAGHWLLIRILEVVAGGGLRVALVR